MEDFEISRIANEQCEYPNSVPQNVAVSVRFTTYQHVNYIEQAVRSVLMQKTSFLFEIIIGEDESTDGTRETCIRLAKEYPEKIRLFLRSDLDKIYINGRKTGKLNAIRNKRACRGKYSAVLEGDDFWIDENKLQKQFDYMEAHPEELMCATRCMYWNPKFARDSLVKPFWWMGVRISYKKLLELRVHPHTSTYLMRQDFAMSLPEWTNKVIQGDLAVVLSAAKQEGYLTILNDLTSVYRIHDGGIMMGVSGHTRCVTMESFWLEYKKYCEVENDQISLAIVQKHLKKATLIKKYFKSSVFISKLFYKIRIQIYLIPDFKFSLLGKLLGFIK